MRCAEREQRRPPCRQSQQDLPPGLKLMAEVMINGKTTSCISDKNAVDACLLPPLVNHSR